MCPITIPDPKVMWLEVVDELIDRLGEGNFCAFDVVELVEERSKAAWARHVADREALDASPYLGVNDGAQWLTDYEAEIDCLEPGELSQHARSHGH